MDFRTCCIVICFVGQNSGHTCTTHASNSPASLLLSLGIWFYLHDQPHNGPQILSSQYHLRSWSWSLNPARGYQRRLCWVSASSCTFSAVELRIPLRFGTPWQRVSRSPYLTWFFLARLPLLQVVAQCAEPVVFSLALNLWGCRYPSADHHQSNVYFHESSLSLYLNISI